MTRVSSQSLTWGRHSSYRQPLRPFDGGGEMSQGESQLSQPFSRILSSLGGSVIGGIAFAVLVAGCTGGHSGFERPDPEDLMPPPDVSESWRQYPPPPSQAPPVQEPAPAGSS